MLKLILKNRTNITLILAGIEVPHNSDIEILPTQWLKLASELTLDSYIDNGTLIVNDGYDDLTKEFGKKYIREGLINRASALNVASLVLPTSNSTLTLDYDSKPLINFTGSISGQIVKLPDARTVNVGYRIEVWNSSTQIVTTTCNAGNTLFSLSTAQKTLFTLQDNSTQCGIWLVEANFLGGTGGGNGTLSFGFDGTASTGRWLETITNNASNNSPYVVAGNKAIRAISLSVTANATTTIAIFKNGTQIDTISLSNSRYATKLNLNHLLVNGDLLSVQTTSGSSSRPTLIIWL